MELTTGMLLKSSDIVKSNMMEQLAFCMNCERLMQIDKMQRYNFYVALSLAANLSKFTISALCAFLWSATRQRKMSTLNS
jgi:hypothetical protein